MIRAIEHGESEHRREEAAAWHARLATPGATIEAWQDFTAWLEADPRNRAAYDEIDLLAAELEDERHSLRQAIGPVATGGLADGSDAPRPFLTRRWAPVLAIAAALAIAMTGVWQYLAAGPAAQIYSTGPREQRAITLADGSMLHLNATSRVSARISGTKRQLALEDGEAFFEVAHDTSRPFIVKVAGQEVRDVGTTFNIHSRPEGLILTVVRGTVDFGPPGGNANARIRVGPGKQIVYDRAADSTAVLPVNADNAIAWRTGRLVYENAAMPKVAADISRYTGARVAVGASARHLRVTGVLMLGREVDMLGDLQALAPVALERSGRDTVIHARPADTDL